MRDLFVYYSASFGKGDGSDVLEYEVYPNDEEYKAFLKAVMTEKDLNDIPELQNLLNKAYKDIEEYEIDNLLDMEDEYTEECDEDDESPFDEGYDLYVRFPDVSEFEPELEEIIDFIKLCTDAEDWEAALEAANAFDFWCDDDEQFGCNEKIEDMLIEMVEADVENAESKLDPFVEKYGRLYYGELTECAFKQAVIYGFYKYVEDNVYEIDINNGWDGECTYLEDTSDKKMIDILMEAGAIGDVDYYEDYEFAVDTLEWEIISCSRSFQKTLLEEYLEYMTLSEKDLIEILKYRGAHDRDEKTCEAIKESMEGIGVVVEDNRIEFESMLYKDGKIMMDVIEEVGMSLKFDGSSNRFETNGVYYI